MPNQTVRRLCHLALVVPLLGAISPAALADTEDLKLTASDAAASDSFGSSIAIDAELVVVGAPEDDDNGSSSGSAYIFEAATGAQLRKLIADDGLFGDLLGTSIAIDGGIVAVGAPRNDLNTLESVGSVYIFDASTGLQIADYFADDYALQDQFGYSVAISNGIVAIGAPYNDDNGTDSGSAYVFDVATGTQLFKLLPDDGESLDLFGWSIAIDNGIIAVGSKWDDDNGSNSGSVYLFDAATGVQLRKLLPINGPSGANFGYSVSIDNGTVAVGAALYNGGSGLNFGAAYLFDAATGLQTAALVRADGAQGDYFGWSIAIDSGLVVVGARYDRDNGSQSGSAYLFDAATGAQVAKLLPSDGAVGDQFGWSAAAGDGVVGVGAYRDDAAAIDSGSAYLFFTQPPCPADLTGDGVLNFFDLAAFIALYNANDPAADLAAPFGVFNFFDLAAYIASYNAGCLSTLRRRGWAQHLRV